MCKLCGIARYRRVERSSQILTLNQLSSVLASSRVTDDRPSPPPVHPQQLTLSQPFNLSPQEEIHATQK